MSENARPAGDRLVPWAELDPQVPYCRQHISRLERDGRFPKRIKVGANRVAWWQSEVEAWKAALPRRYPNYSTVPAGLRSGDLTETGVPVAEPRRHQPAGR